MRAGRLMGLMGTPILSCVSLRFADYLVVWFKEFEPRRRQEREGFVLGKSNLNRQDEWVCSSKHINRKI